ncbi:MAG: hypothetical protein GY749_29630, partial [Desulfobacteraceae bacterium]|nr:hypothetical protein [Desulfobacteraceae bacterium]
MNKIKEIQLADGSSIFVEMEEADLPESVQGKQADDLPEGAEETSAAEKVYDAMQLLKKTLSSAAETVHEGIQKAEPDEWTLELNIGFKGKANPVPVILSGESNAAIKVTAKWFKYE